ncbi:MAG: thioredoxin family protein [Bacteroidales bacterium]|nr:thioredoxin family protein [Bacteroidales bacterium]
MKQLLTIAIIITVFWSCGNNTNPLFMTPLDTLSFKEKVFDTDTVFDYKQSKPAVIYFYSSRVKNCEKQTPEITQIANIYYSDIYFYSVNYEDNIKIAEAFKIKKLPAFVFVPLNSNVQTVSGGVLSYHDLEKAFDDIFGINK